MSIVSALLCLGGLVGAANGPIVAEGYGCAPDETMPERSFVECMTGPWETLPWVWEWDISGACETCYVCSSVCLPDDNGVEICDARRQSPITGSRLPALAPVICDYRMPETGWTHTSNPSLCNCVEVPRAECIAAYQCYAHDADGDLDVDLDDWLVYIESATLEYGCCPICGAGHFLDADEPVTASSSGIMVSWEEAETPETAYYWRLACLHDIDKNELVECETNAAASPAASFEGDGHAASVKSRRR